MEVEGSGKEKKKGEEYKGVEERETELRRK